MPTPRPVAPRCLCKGRQGCPSSFTNVTNLRHVSEIRNIAQQRYPPPTTNKTRGTRLDGRRLRHRSARRGWSRQAGMDHMDRTVDSSAAARSVGRMACTARFSASSASTLGMPRSSSRATSSLVVAAERPRCSACSPMVSGPLPGRRGAHCPRCAPSDLGPNHALVTGCPSWTLPVRTPVNPRVTGITHRARRTVQGTRVWRRRGGDVRGGARDLSWI